jgi:hypothetical protein
MEKVSIQELNKLFDLDELSLFNNIMRMGNRYGRKILHQEDSKLFVDPIIYEEVLEELRSLNEYCFKDFKNYENRLVPFKNGSYIYYLFDNRQIVYVGQTINVAARIPCHLKDKKFDDVYYFEVPNKDRLLIESYNIEEHKPFYNGLGVDSQILLKGVLEKVLERI